MRTTQGGRAVAGRRLSVRSARLIAVIAALLLGTVSTAAAMSRGPVALVRTTPRVTVSRVHLRPARHLRLFHPRHATPGVLAARREPLRMVGSHPATSSHRAGAAAARRLRSAAAAAPAACAVPGAPGSPAASVSGAANQATITWTAAADNGTAISAYEVRETSGADVGAAIATSGSATTATLTGLSGGTAAQFSIVAESSCGTGAAAATAAVTPTGTAGSYETSVLADAPSVFYRLDEPSGTLMADSSTHAADGTYTGQGGLNAPAPLASDPAPSSSYASCCSGLGTGTSTLPDYDSARTVEAWVNTTSGTTNMAIAGYGTTGTDGGFIVSLSSQAINVDAYNDYLTFPTARPMDSGVWHQVDVTFDGTTVSVYLDGQLVGSSPFTAASINTQPDGLVVGYFPGYNAFSGDLGDVAVYPSALSASQIATIFGKSGYSRPTTPTSPAAAAAGANSAKVTWGASTATGALVTGYLVSPATGNGSSVVTGAGATSATITGLAAGSDSFKITPLDDYGSGTAATTGAVSVTGASSTYASTVLSSSPTGFYRLSDSGTAGMADSSGHGATGTYQPDTTVGVAGPLANDPATAVTGTSSEEVGQGSPTLPLYAGARTLEGWFSTTSGGTQWLAGYGSEATAQGFSVGIQSNDVYVQGYSDDLTFNSSTSLQDGNWHFVAVTSDGTSATVYVDGVSLGTKTFPQPLDTLPDLNPAGLLIGSTTGHCCGNFSGQLADVALFSSQLSATTVTSQFAASGLGRPPAPTGLSATAGANRATVSWTAPSGADPAVTGYLVVALNNGIAQNAVSVPATSLSTTLTGLAAGTAYTFRVRAINLYGAGNGATTTATVTPTGTASTYASTTIGDAPLAFYRLADTGPLMADSSGNSFHGFYGASASEGQTGPLANDSAGSISNANGVAGEAVPQLPLYGSARTLEGWIDTTNCCGEQYIASYGTQTTGGGFSLAVTPNAVIVSGYSDDVSVASPVPLENGQWHFIVASTDGSTVRVFVDGVKIGNATFPQTLDTIAATSAPVGLLIGTGVSSCCEDYQGQLADVALFQSAFGLGKVSAQFAASGLASPPAPTGVHATGGANQATITWTAPANPSPAITGYLVTALRAGKAGNAVTVPSGSTQTTITGLVGGASYTFTVQAINAYGPGASGTSTAVTPTGATSTFDSTVLSAAPSVFWRLADSGTALVADSSGQGAEGNDNTSAVTLGDAGPLPNDPSTAAGDNGQTPLLSGQATLPLYGSARSVQAWVDTTNCCSTQQLVSYGTQSTTEGFSVGISSTAVIVSGYNDDLSFTSPVTLTNGVWHLITVTVNASGSVTAYVDGKAIGTQSIPRALDTLPTSSGLIVGAGVGTCCGGFSGQIADVAVFPTPLSGAQVTAEFAASGNGVPSAPTAPHASAGANQATVTWTAPANSSPAVTGYLVTALKGGTAANAIGVPASASSATITGLVGGASYTFRIQALNSYGASAAATTAAVTPTGATSTYASTVLAAAPSAFYRLADTASTVLADSSGHGATGSYNATATLNQTGPLANDSAAAIQDGGSGAAGQATPSLPVADAARTIEGWVKETSGGTYGIAGYGSTVTGEGFQLAVQPNQVVVSGYNDDIDFPSAVTLNDGGWHLIAATTDGTSVTAYVDGKAIGTRKLPQTLNTMATPSGLVIGAGAESCCYDYTGQLADIAVFPTALTAAQMTAQFTASGLAVPAAPTAPAAVKGANQATVTWTAPAAATPAITGYLVTALKGGVAVNAQSVPAGSTSTVITGLAGSTAYTFKVQAVNEYGPGAAATTASVTTTGTASTYASTTLADGPSVFYRLGDTASSTLADSSGHGATATGRYTTNATLGQTGPFSADSSGSVLSSGSGDFAQAFPTLPLFAQSRTIEAWIKTTNGSEGQLVGYGSDGTSQGIGLAQTASSVILEGYADDLSWSTSTLDDGSWHFLAVTTNGTTATAYLDGTSLGTQTFTEPLDTLSAPQGLLLGSGPQNCCGSYAGSLADVAIFPSVLTAAQITAQNTAAGSRTAAHPATPADRPRQARA
jgi:hypothetical protein